MSEICQHAHSIKAKLLHNTPNNYIRYFKSGLSKKPHGLLLAAGNPTFYAAIRLTKYRATSPTLDQARLIETDNLTDTSAKAVCLKAGYSHSNFSRIRTALGTVTNAIHKQSIKSTLSQWTTVFKGNHPLSNNCYQFINHGGMNSLVGSWAAQGLNRGRGCQIVCAMCQPLITGTHSNLAEIHHKLPRGYAVPKLEGQK